MRSPHFHGRFRIDGLAQPKDGEAQSLTYRPAKYGAATCPTCHRFRWVKTDFSCMKPLARWNRCKECRRLHKKPPSWSQRLASLDEWLSKIDGHTDRANWTDRERLKEWLEGLTQTEDPLYDYKRASHRQRGSTRMRTWSGSEFKFPRVCSVDTSEPAEDREPESDDTDIPTPEPTPRLRGRPLVPRPKSRRARQDLTQYRKPGRRIESAFGPVITYYAPLDNSASE